MDQPPEKPRRLYRSTTNKVLAGVCGGLGEYFNIDPTILRILFVAIIFWGGSGVVLYIILWLVIPEAGQEQLPMEKRFSQAGQEMKAKAQQMAADIKVSSPHGLTPAIMVGAILVIVGASALAQVFIPWRIFRWDIFWPILIIVLGLMVIIRRK